jgi:hypothetical protein
MRKTSWNRRFLTLLCNIGPFGHPMKLWNISNNIFVSVKWDADMITKSTILRLSNNISYKSICCLVIQHLFINNKI